MSARLSLESALFWPIRAPLASLSTGELPEVEAIDRALSEPAKVNFRVFPRTHREPYDESIVRDGVVPTRAQNPHDFFNALVWATFPNAKREVHRLQHRYVSEAIASGRAAHRVPEHDALAMLDEGGVLLFVDETVREPIVAGLACRDGAPLARASKSGHARMMIFGHALYEHLATKTSPVWGIGVLLPAAPSENSRADLQRADELLAEAIRRDARSWRRSTFPGVLLEDAHERGSEELPCD